MNVSITQNSTQTNIQQGVGFLQGPAGVNCFVYPEDHEAVGDGSTDDTAALQAAIEAAQDSGDTLYLRSKTYYTTDTLVISKPITIDGAGAWETFSNTDRPDDQPFIQGCRILFGDNTGKDAIKITVKRRTVVLKNFGIEWATPYNNTGHGINCVPPVLNAGFDDGVFSSRWENIKVAGHDGNHYGINMINGLYNDIVGFRWYGGGGIALINNSGGGWHYGNTHIDHPFGILCQGGTASGYRLQSVTDKLNFITMTKPQCNVEGAHPGQGISPTNAQRPVHADYNSSDCSIKDGDFESGIGHLVNYYGQMNWDVQGSYLGDVSEPFTDFTPALTGGINTSQNQMGKAGHLIGQATFQPTAGAAATLTVMIGPDTTHLTQIIDMSIPANAGVHKLPYQFYCPGGWYYRITAANVTMGRLLNTNQTSWGLGI